MSISAVRKAEQERNRLLAALKEAERAVSDSRAALKVDEKKVSFGMPGALYAQFVEKSGNVPLSERFLELAEAYVQRSQPARKD